MTISVLVPWRHAVRHHQWLITAPTDHALFCVGGFPQVPVVDDSLSSCYKHNTISHVLFICTINCSYWINTSITIYVMFCYYSKMFEVLIEIYFYYLILFDKYYTTKILPIWCKTLNNQSIFDLLVILFSVALKKFGDSPLLLKGSRMETYALEQGRVVVVSHLQWHGVWAFAAASEGPTQSVPRQTMETEDLFLPWFPGD